ncbi:MAG: AAA family ATPase [Melioribacteraceae bacterium]|nr:AAA family ATPase [Melioribacteraceae bacterium]
MTGQIEKLHSMLRNQTDTQPLGNNIITFTSGKGGTGKTFVSLNVATELSYMGYKTLYVDFDSNLSNADILLNISPEKTIVDYFTGRCLFRNAISSGDHNLDYIFGESGKIDFPRITFENVSRFINDCSRINSVYDYVIIDTGAGISQEIIYLLSKSNRNVFVTTPEPTSLMDTYAVIKLLLAKAVAVNNSVIINSAENENEANEALNNLNTALSHFLKTSINYLGYIEFSMNVRKSVVDQVLFVDQFKKSVVAGQIRTIATNLSSAKQMANINHL